MSATLRPARFHHPAVPAGCPLTLREFEVLRRFADGETFAAIARSTGRSVVTVSNQAKTACARLGVRGGVIHAVIHCFKAGWLIIEDDQTVTIAPVPEPEPEPEPAPEPISTLTAAQRAYLHTVELHRQVSSPEEKAATLKIMDRALGPLCKEANIDPDPDRGRPDIIDRLIQDFRRVP